MAGLPELNDLPRLGSIYCSSNQLTTLPNLSNLPQLNRLDCSDNLLSSLPDLSSQVRLFNLNCSFNFLTGLPNVSMPGQSTLDIRENLLGEDDCDLINELRFTPMTIHYSPQGDYWVIRREYPQWRTEPGLLLDWVEAINNRTAAYNLSCRIP